MEGQRARGAFFPLTVGAMRTALTSLRRGGRRFVPPTSAGLYRELDVSDPLAGPVCRPGPLQEGRSPPGA